MQSAISVSASQLRALEGPFLSWQGGSESAFAVGVGAPQNLTSSQLAFVSDLNFLSSAREKASLLIVEQKLLSAGLKPRSDQALWTTPSLKAAMVLVLPLFDPRNLINDPLISPMAFIHPTAQVGARTRIAAGVSIGANVVIGEDCDLHANVVVEAFCHVGSRCVIHAGSVIGSDGFGFATDPRGVQHKVPQIGIVVLEDDVELGALCAVDRATLGETRLGQGSKFDNFCHVGHNCRIGKHGVFAASFFVAGSSTIGDHFMCGGRVDISDHVNICDRVVLGGRAAVTKDITEPGAYTGYPLQPLKDGLKTAQNLTKLTPMRKQLKLISKKLGIETDRE